LCQIVYSEIDCDKVITQASSKELVRYGMSVGLKNYAAAYATGLLCARRCLTKLGLAELYEGQDDPDGEVVSTEYNGRTHFVEEVDGDKRPFRCVLDIGLVATTVGNRVFGALKGATDGGLDIPHNEKNFPGYDKEDKAYDAETHKTYIFGGHVAEYMAALKEDDDEDEGEYAKVFSQYIAAGLDDENLEEKWGEVHAAIRADPSPANAQNAKTRNAANTQGHNKKFANRKGLCLKQRKDRVKQKKAAAAAAEE
jgi:large subunit ribosomal protein L5e